MALNRSLGKSENIQDTSPASRPCSTILTYTKPPRKPKLRTSRLLAQAQRNYRLPQTNIRTHFSKLQLNRLRGFDKDFFTPIQFKISKLISESFAEYRPAFSFTLLINFSVG